MLLEIITQNPFLSYHVEEKLTNETNLQRVFEITKLQINLSKLVLCRVIYS
jgi:hypothetical protein